MSAESTVHPIVPMLIAGVRRWFDPISRRFVRALTIFVPYGCPDWGERGGRRNELCAFCALPNAVQFARDAFNDGRPFDIADQLRWTIEALQIALSEHEGVDEIWVFNAGSALAMPDSLLLPLVEEIAAVPGAQRILLEARASLVTANKLDAITAITNPSGKALTIRIGVETADDDLRLRKLKKGHTRTQLLQACTLMRERNVTAGGYALLNPFPGLDPGWARQQAKDTLDFILGSGPGQLHMAEAYFCSTNVGPGTPLTHAWEKGDFAPADLWSVLDVLRYGCNHYGPRVHMLPFADEPELLAVSANHAPSGLPQSLEGATGCDRQFHAMLEQYRQTMDPAVLVPPTCVCRPPWFG